MVSFVALNYENLNFTFYIIFAFLAVYIFLFGFAIGQNFTAPVRRLLKKANDLSKGDLKSRFYAESKDEIGQLSNVFNRIADKLEESNSENELTKRSVGIKVEAETQSLREVINALEKKVQNRTLEIQKIVGDLEKFKEYSKDREVESAELKSEILGLKEKLDKRGSKKGRASNKNDDMPSVETYLKGGEKPVLQSMSNGLMKKSIGGKIKKSKNLII